MNPARVLSWRRRGRKIVALRNPSTTIRRHRRPLNRPPARLEDLLTAIETKR